jgi:hypothetical protein
MSFESGLRRGGRGGRGGNAPRTRPFPNSKQPVTPDIQKHPLGPLLHTISQGSIESLLLDDPLNNTISDCELVASYNWLDEKTPTIVVPGEDRCLKFDKVS